MEPSQQLLQKLCEAWTLRYHLPFTEVVVINPWRKMANTCPEVFCPQILSKKQFLFEVFVSTQNKARIA